MRLVAWLLPALLLFATRVEAQAPRVAIVVSGDPSPAVVDAANALRVSLEESALVSLPSDEATNAALTGVSGTSEDGLDELRGTRRRLGISADSDREVLAALGARLELVVLVVVRGATSPAARVFDVNERRFFAGEASLGTEGLETAREFIVTRAESSSRRQALPTPSAAAQASPDASAATAETQAAPLTEAPPERRSFMRRNWPFFVAGALLVGATTYFVASRDRGDSGPPVIHIRPGGN